MMFAITNPQNRDRLMEVIAEELTLLLDDGITETELDAAKQSILQREQVRRAEDRSLCQMLAESIFAGRDMRYFANLEQSVEQLSVDEVNAAIRKYIDPERLVIVTAGDFSKSPVGGE